MYSLFTAEPGVRNQLSNRQGVFIMKKINKVPSAVVVTLLAAFLSGNAVAITEQEARTQLDRIPAKAAEARQTAQTVLSELVAAGVPVDSAYEVVRSAVDRNYSASDLRQVGAEMRDQIKQGIPAEHVSKIADQSINAGNSAAATQKVQDTFQARVEKGMPADKAYAASSSDIKKGAGAGMGSGMGSGSGSGAGSGMGGGAGSGMGGGAGGGAGSGMGSGSGMPGR